MKNPSCILFLFLVLFLASVTFGAVPPVNVTVSDVSGKVAFKGVTNATGMFATTNLKPGSYVVQFNSTSTAVRDNRYALVISAGKTKVSANAIAGERFTGVGVAMRITAGEATGETLKKHPELNNPAAIRALERMEREARLNITGQVTKESTAAH